MKRILLFTLICTTLTVHANLDHDRLVTKISNTISNQLLNDWGVVDMLQKLARTGTPDTTLFNTHAGRTLPLFKNYPALSATIAYTPLGTFPTPVRVLENLGTHLHLPNLYLKDEGVSSPIFGGSKVRKLEFVLADARAHGVKQIITIGDTGSNHALSTGIFAQQLGMQSMSLLTPQPTAAYLQRNLLLSHHYGIELHEYPTGEFRDIMVLGKFFDYFNEHNSYPYVIPSGGSTPLGALGYVNAAFELKQQISDGLLPEPDYIYVPFGSMGTAMGLIVGLMAVGVKSKVVGVAVSQGKTKARARAFAQRVISLLRTYDKTFPNITITDDDFELYTDFVGPGYGHVTDAAAAAIRTRFMEEFEAFTLDGTYAGKALAALLRDVHEKKITSKSTVLFWNTYCNQTYDEITQGVDYHDLPLCFHGYF